MSGAAAIVTERLTKRYGATVALDDLDLEVRPGEVLGFLGPNGAGKTTTVRLLLGLIRPTAGGARVLGLDPWVDAVALHRRLSFVPSELSLWPSLTGGQVLELLGRLHGRVDTAYRDVLVERFLLDPTRKVRAYSHGNRQKVGIVAAFMTAPELLVLDEPTTGLDPIMENAFRECVREARDRGATVFLSSHLLAEVEAVCDRVAILRRGRLAEIGTLEQLRHLRARSVEARFAGAAPRLDGIPGVSGLTTENGTLRCRVSGSMAPLLAALADAGVTTIDSREPSLEELFMAQYGDGG
jgi:ABC-2 type transport system ATP-binding protein